MIAAITAILAFLAYRQWEAMVKATQAAQESASAAKASADSLKNAERAYVGITYRQKGDDNWPEDYNFHPCQRSTAQKVEGMTCYRLHVRIVNTGRTPANVLGGVIQAVWDLDNPGFSFTDVPDDKRGRMAPNFLHSGGMYSEKLNYQMADNEVFLIGLDRMWLVGYLDYRDIFDRRHRAGFCRRAGGGTDTKKNTLCVDSTCRDYNYDYETDEKGNRKVGQ